MTGTSPFSVFLADEAVPRVALEHLVIMDGDGNNDVFYPRGSGVFKIQNIKVFNRWGEVVFEKSNFNANDAAAGWNGTFKGKPLAADVFVYIMQVICDNNSTLTFRGNITLLR